MTNPLPKNWFTTTLKVVPSLKWALAVAALAAIFSVARLYAGGTFKVIVVCLILIGLSILMILFSTFAAKKRAKGIHVDIPIYILIYLVVLLVVAFGVLGTSSLWFGWPIPSLRIGETGSASAPMRARIPRSYACVDHQASRLVSDRTHEAPLRRDV